MASEQTYEKLTGILQDVFDDDYDQRSTGAGAHGRGSPRLG